MIDRSNFSVLLHILRYLNRHEDAYSSLIAKDIDVTYSHIAHVINQLINNKLVVSSKSGRRVYLSLTAKGKRVALNIDTVMTDLDIPLKKGGLNG